MARPLSATHLGQEHNDAHRQRELERLGFVVVRFSAQAVISDPVGVAARIGEQVRRLKPMP